ncbi:UBP-type zinc finger domain-containing protein [Nonomuraea rosea]|uniref:UBP-type zinc finger domain-containing protein n=1 Tax=Nonomuraea rosea TaxID=638574 RepID=A0ABP6VQL9_9ACTN
MAICEHLSKVGDPPAKTPEGCEECLAAGGRWVHLRRCLECGHIGCCDSSPAKHATAHFHSAGHPVVQSFEPGESWRWCFADNQMA